MSDRVLAVVFFLSLALLVLVGGGPFLLATLASAAASGGVLVVRGLRDGGDLARRVAVVAGAIALVLALSIWYFPFALLPGLVAAVLVVRLRRDGERALLPTVLVGAAAVVVGAIVVVALAS